MAAVRRTAFEIDVNLLYHKSEQDIAYTEQLATWAESLQLRVHFDERDGRLGASCIDEHFKRIEFSNFTIVILSSAFLQDDWDVYCSQAAFKELIRQNRLISIAVPGFVRNDVPKMLILEDVLLFDDDDWALMGLSNKWQRLQYTLLGTQPLSVHVQEDNQSISASAYAYSDNPFNQQAIRSFQNSHDQFSQPDYNANSNLQNSNRVAQDDGTQYSGQANLIDEEGNVSETQFMTINQSLGHINLFEGSCGPDVEADLAPATPQSANGPSIPLALATDTNSPSNVISFSLENTPSNLQAGNSSSVSSLSVTDEASMSLEILDTSRSTSHQNGETPSSLAGVIDFPHNALHQQLQAAEVPDDIPNSPDNPEVARLESNEEAASDDASSKDSGMEDDDVTSNAGVNLIEVEAANPNVALPADAVQELQVPSYRDSQSSTEPKEVHEGSTRHSVLFQSDSDVEHLGEAPNPNNSIVLLADGLLEVEVTAPCRDSQSSTERKEVHEGGTSDSVLFQSISDGQNLGEAANPNNSVVSLANGLPDIEVTAQCPDSQSSTEQKEVHKGSTNNSVTFQSVSDDDANASLDNMASTKVNQHNSSLTFPTLVSEESSSIDTRVFAQQNPQKCISLHNDETANQQYRLNDNRVTTSIWNLIWNYVDG